MGVSLKIVTYDVVMFYFNLMHITDVTTLYTEQSTLATEKKWSN